MASTLKFSRYPMGYSPDAPSRYGNNGATSGSVRFPAHAHPVNPCDLDRVPTGTVKIYSGDGKVSWGWNRSGNLKRLEPFRDPAGVTRWQERGDIYNAVAWST